MNRTRITISFKAEDSLLIEHLQKVAQQRSISSYIRELIRNDMAGTSSTKSVDELANAILEKLGGTIQIITEEEKPTDDESPIGFEEKSIIDQLF